MLVLSRKRNQSIEIGNIVITVNQIKNNKVVLGIDAPMDVKIRRSELAALVREAVDRSGSNADQTICDQRSSRSGELVFPA